MDEIKNNPFATLFTPFDNVQNKKDSKIIDQEAEVKPDSKSDLSLGLCEKLEEVLVITTDREKTKNCSVLLEDLNFGKRSASNGLEFDTVTQAIFERLMQDDVTDIVVCKCGGKHSDDVTENRPLFYLYQCYCRSQKFLVNSEECASVKKAICSQCAVYLKNPDWFRQSLDEGQLIDLIQVYYSEPNNLNLKSFIVDVSNYIVDEEKGGDGSLLAALQVSLRALKQRVMGMSVVDCNLLIHFKILEYFMLTPELSAVLLKFCTPTDLSNGRSYQDSLLGAFLSASCLPRKPGDPYEFFEEPSRFSFQEHDITEQNLWPPMQNVVHEIEKCFYTLLKQSGETKELLLNWIGSCLNANSSRSKIWNNQMDNVMDTVHCSDGFMLNLGSVLLRLCKPFSEPSSPKLLKIQPMYCAARSSGTARVDALTKETCLLPSENRSTSSDKQFTFITEVFYCCHYAMHIGFKMCHERLSKIGQDLNRIQRVYEEATIQGGPSSETVEHIQESMEQGMMKFLSLRTALKDPDMLSNMLMFHVATATWLINVAISEDSKTFATLSFPLDTAVPEMLKYCPELLVENIKDCAQFMHHHSPGTLEISHEFMQHLLSLILVFMGSPERMKNPHLRASLAELLEVMLPSKDETSSLFSTNVYNKALLVNHPHIQQLVPTLLHVFVSIEMTGQSVAFEQKFQYRRPMYAIFDYIRTVGLHLNRLKHLATEAEANIDAAVPPLFLRFINLLMNDAIFLLDEALSYMGQLKELQSQRENGGWQQLPTNQRLQNEGNLQHVGMLARFHNIMGNDTIHTLKWLTAEIQSIFCHPTLVDRITAMLNYFLLHLVGPKQKNLKVKDMDRYDFKPHELVRNICQVYINLGQLSASTSRTFCSAVSQDGRSYSPELFAQTEAVLVKIGKIELAENLNQIARQVKELAEEIKQDETALADAPDEFLDPIMNTLMSDPVCLPTSGIIVDRTTIARHLLSDQSDPFNRSPLSMDMVQPDEELRIKIQSWMKQQKAEKHS